ncbi:C2 calcium-dependent domain-containing protein 4C [Brachyhypopomus gauderio]|uniref:C2 calcium-dependent domain-containing protein 4C n=1 Tax=Brachyhypopomus gauderio TaxID=698409 RepID=UPI0040418513
MWILRKIQETAESLPGDLSQLVSRNSEEISAKANLLHKLHSNVLTPEKIPDFFLPPRLSRRSLVAAEGIVPKCLGGKGPICDRPSPSKPNLTPAMKTDKNRGVTVDPRGRAKPHPFSLKCYESGLFESPNTRRKESLFHSTFTSYKLERMATSMAPKLASMARLKVGSVDSETLSSAESSPHSSPPPSWPIRRKHEDTVSQSLLPSKEFLNRDIPVNSNKPNHIAWSMITKTEKTGVTGHQPNHSTLAPPLQFPLDMLHCQERLHSEHILLLPHGGRVRISASHSSHAGGPATIRVRVVSVEGLRDAGDPRPLHCGLTLSLTPGKLQRQQSATIKNCRDPVFNEDFFFTDPEAREDGLREMALRVKVLDKSSGMGRAVVLGVVVKPLSQLLPL